MSRSVVIFRNELLGRSETFVAAQASSLVRFAPRFVGLRRVSGLDVPGTPTILTGGGLLGRAQRARIHFFGVPRAAVRKIRATRPALVHAHFGVDGVTAMSLARGLGVPLVVTFHGYDATWPDERFRTGSLAERMYLARRARLARYASRMLCVSDFIRRQVVAKGFPEARCQVHYTGVDTQLFRADPAIRREPIVLFVGRLVEQKGCDFLLRAIASVQRELDNVEVIIIGDGPAREHLESQARALRAVRFLGAQPAETVRHWLNRASVFCTPSIGEGFGMVFVEAQAMGVPVVAFSSGGIPEAVADGETGLLAPELDVDRLAVHILALLSDRTLWSRLSEAGQVRTRRLFDLNVQARALEETYDRVIAES